LVFLFIIFFESAKFIKAITFSRRKRRAEKDYTRGTTHGHENKPPEGQTKAKQKELNTQKTNLFIIDTKKKKKKENKRI
jgi:hypothetical protein